MDIGTPERYLEATWDILERRVETRVQPTAPGMLVGAGCARSPTAPRSGPRVGARPPAAGSRPGAEVRDSVLLDGCVVGDGRPGQRLDPRRRASRSRPAPSSTARWSAADERVPVQTSLMLDDVLEMPEHLRDALWRIESARPEADEGLGGDRLRDGGLGDRRRSRRRGAGETG